MTKKIASFFLSLSFLWVLFPSFVHSEPLGNFQNALGEASTVAAKSGIETKQELEDYIKGLTTIALSLIGIIFFILMVYGGYKWMIARGDAKSVESAKDTIIRGIIGLVVVILAYAISSFIITQLVEISTTK